MKGDTTQARVFVCVNRAEREREEITFRDDSGTRLKRMGKRIGGIF